MFVEYFFLSFSENEYNKPGNLTTMGLYILAAIWRTFPANSIKEKKGAHHDLLQSKMPCLFYEAQM